MDLTKDQKLMILRASNWLDEDENVNLERVADEQIQLMVDFELKCREELHKLRVICEKKKARNLDLKYKLLLMKHELLNRKKQAPSE